jgi:glycosyltransferase involved in cell wall biosynthesis
LKVELIVHALSGGGAERVAVNLANGWRSLGWDVGVTLLTRVSEADYPVSPGVEVVSLGEDRPSRSLLDAAVRNVLRLGRLRRRIQDRSPDVTLGIMAGSSVMLAIAGAGLKGARIGCEHNNPPYSLKSPAWAALRRLVYRSLDAVVVLTSGADQWVAKNAPNKRIAIIPNAVVWPTASSTPHLDPRAVVVDSSKVILAVGRFTAAKGFDYLIDAYSRVHTQIPDWRLVILGDGPDRPALEAQVDAAGLSGRVHMPGRAGNISDWYARADLFAMASRHEGLPMVLLEAMASGLPAVTWDYAYGPADVIRPGVDGVITPMGDVQQLADAIAALARDDARRADLASRAPDVRDRFSEAAVQARWLALFKDVGAHD